MMVYNFYYRWRKQTLRKRVQWANRVQGCCSHVATVRERSKRQKSMFDVCCHRKETSIEVHQERPDKKTQTQLTVASENDVLEARKEAIQNSIDLASLGINIMRENRGDPSQSGSLVSLISC